MKPLKALKHHHVAAVQPLFSASPHQPKVGLSPGFEVNDGRVDFYLEDQPEASKPPAEGRGLVCGTSAVYGGFHSHGGTPKWVVYNPIPGHTKHPLNGANYGEIPY